MNIKTMADEVKLLGIEQRDWGDNLQRAIEAKQVKRPMEDVDRIRQRLPGLRAAARALHLIEAWRDRLPPEFIDAVEVDQ